MTDFNRSICALLLVLFLPVGAFWLSTQIGASSAIGYAEDKEKAHELTDSIEKEGVLVKQGVYYKKVDTESGAVAHVVLVNTKYGDISVRPYISDTTETTSAMALKNHALVAVNAGFFNLSDGESTSYVFISGKQMCEPKHNMALINNKGLKPFLPKIFNRSELRFLTGKGGDLITVQAHEDPVPKGYKLKDSLQAGPQLLPKLTARDEAFIRNVGNGKEVDSIGSNLKAARTAFGITGDGTAAIVCVEGQRTKEFSTGMSLPDLASFMRRLGCETAINFDGGSSSTMVVKLPAGVPAGSPPCEAFENGLNRVFSADPERKVKSILYVAERLRVAP